MLMWIEISQMRDEALETGRIKNDVWRAGCSALNERSTAHTERSTKKARRSCHKNYINNEQTFDLKAFKHISCVMRY